jgi:arylsulfatase A-like enzyme
MSVYGYNRRTTPTLEKLAAEGVVFEHAYSNSSSTTPSTASFMTSLHSSVLRGNLGQGIPSEAVTMAERFHRAGYQTAVFTTNPNASSHGLERGADVLPESGPRSNARSSLLLHQAFWTWRERSPGQPFWVHFQTTDVHDSDDTFGIDRVTPFAGLFLSQEEERALNDDVSKLEAVEGYGIYSDSWRQTGISRVGFFTRWQALYDQTLAHNDYHLGRLIDRLKALGEWHNTLLIVSADHSITAATTDLALAQLDPLPPSWSLTDGGNTTGPMLRSSVSRVPLIVVWPGHLAGGRRFDTPVSLIDVLPTVLDLAGLPKPEVLQGQSLAPLLRGQSGWTPRPVILDEFGTDPATGELRGRIEVIDGRWGVSMWVGPPVPNPARQRPWPVLLYDLWNDPLCIAPVNEQQPDLVDKYTKFLLDQWKDHEALAKQFKPGPKVALTPEQLERLRSLGYIR